MLRSEFVDISKKEAGNCIIGVVCVEGEVTRLPKQIVDIYLANLTVVAEGDVVLAQLNMQVVGQCVIGSTEKTLWVVADTEETRRRDRVDLLERGLPDVHTQVGHTNTARNGAAGCIVDLIADDEVVQDVIVESVRLGDHRVVVVDLRLVCVG